MTVSGQRSNDFSRRVLTERVITKGSKRWYCAICGKKLISSKNLQRHYQYKHKNVVVIDGFYSVNIRRCDT